MRKIYFNFPIELLPKIIDDPKNTLNEILLYHIFRNAKIKGNTSIHFKKTATEFNVILNDYNSNYSTGKRLFDDFNKGNLKPLHTGIEASILWDYKGNEKPIRKIIQLVAYLAIGSVLQKQEMCKMDNTYLFSRMSGFNKRVDPDQFHSEVKKYNTEYKSRTLREDLQLDWGLKIYAKHVKGFWVSKKLSEENLYSKVIKLKRQYKLKRQQRRQHKLIHKVKKDLDKNDEVSK